MKCEFCNKNFKVKSKYYPTRFCSYSCRGKWQYQHEINRPPKQNGNIPWNKSKKMPLLSKERMDKGNPMRRGGTTYDQGYKYIKIKNLAGRYISEHRLVMQNYIKRKLNINEIIHHINGIRDDNRFDNLMIMTRSAHSRLHRYNESIHTAKN